jgi:ubiquitin-protein ligase
LVRNFCINFVAFPGEAANNYLVLKGFMTSSITKGNYPLKLIIPVNYPNVPPKVYFDMQLTLDVVKRLDYIGDQNMLTITYMKHWNPIQSTLAELLANLIPLVDKNPPVPANQLPPPV